MIEKILLATIDRDELACALLEGMLDEDRPAGSTPRQALDMLQGMKPDLAAGCYRAADRVVALLTKKLNAGVIQGGNA